jgi:pilus assembly protein CpaE
MDQTLQLAIITNDHFRAEALTAVTAGLNWRLEKAVAPAQPVAWLRRLSVDVLLLDLDVPNALGLLREVSTTLPHLTVLALVTPQHLTDLQEALTAGASSFVTFPVDAVQFPATVMRVVQESPKRQARAARGRLVAITGLKGGVGRTTLAVNMAAVLRQRIEGDVVLVEAHHGLSDASLMLNLLPRHTLATLATEQNPDADVLQGHLQPHASRIKVLAAPPDVSQLVELPVETWRSILTQLREIAPYVVADTSAVADAVLSEVLTLADDIVVMTGPDLAGLRSAVALLKSLDEEANVHGRAHVVLNRAGVRGGVNEAAAARQLGEALAAAIPEDEALATFSLNRGVPFVLSHPRSILARKVQEFTEQLFELKTAAKPKRSGPSSLWPLGNKERTVQQAMAAR